MEGSQKDAARSKYRSSQRNKRGGARGGGRGSTTRGTGPPGSTSSSAHELDSNVDRYEEEEAPAVGEVVRLSQGADLAALLEAAAAQDSGTAYRSIENEFNMAPPPGGEAEHQGVSLDMAALAECLNQLPLHQLLSIDARYLESCQGVHAQAKACPSNTNRPKVLPTGTGTVKAGATGNVDGAATLTAAIPGAPHRSTAAQPPEGAVSPGIHPVGHAQNARAAAMVPESVTARASQVDVAESVAVSPALVSPICPPTTAAAGKSSLTAGKGAVSVSVPERVGAWSGVLKDEDDDLDELLNLTAAPQSSAFGAVKSRVSAVVGVNKQEQPSLEDWLDDL